MSKRIKLKSMEIRMTKVQMKVMTRKKIRMVIGITMGPSIKEEKERENKSLFKQRSPLQPRLKVKLMLIYGTQVPTSSCNLDGKCPPLQRCKISLFLILTFNQELSQQDVFIAIKK